MAIMNEMAYRSEAERLMRLIRILISGFIVGLIVSGITAFPLPQEVAVLVKYLGIPPDALPENLSGLQAWIAQVKQGLDATQAQFPFLFYGTDWLAFGHIVIAIAFVGPLRDPVRNIWVIEWGMIACALVIPLALICGPIRGIPFYWQLIDCSFGVVGIIPLVVARKYIKKLDQERA